MEKFAVPLERWFFEQPTVVVAQELLGKTLVVGAHQGIIEETEAYVGEDDPACHAARGKTPRTTVMYGLAGYSYVYLIYGMYHCLNIVTEAEGFPAAVLIRGIRLFAPETLLLDGPGKLCRSLGITKEHNCMDMTKSPELHVLDQGRKPNTILQTPRIGLKVGQDKLWRFVSK